MKNWKRNILPHTSTVKQALARLNEIGVASNVLFVTDEMQKLLGSVTDGDIRRGFLENIGVGDAITSIMNVDCKRIFKNNIDNNIIRQYRERSIITIPVVDEQQCIIDILNLNEYREIIPVDAVIMAGGKGERLLPLTKELPKPLLKVGNKPIVEHNIDRLIHFGVQHIHISINYLGDKI